MVEKREKHFSKNHRIFAVILAAGTGKRMGGFYKQFVQIKKKPIIFYSIDVFLKCKFINEIIVVVPRAKYSYAKKIIFKEYVDKPISVIIGGKTRRHSSYNALKFVKNNKKCDFVVFHDGVRPLLSVEMTKAVVREAIKCGAAVLGSKVLNVVAKVKNGKIIEALNPQSVFNTQTPHCYGFGLIWKAHGSKINRGRKFDLLENIELVFAVGKKIVLIDEFYRNMKLTYKQDIIPIRAILKKIKPMNYNFFRLDSK